MPNNMKRAGMTYKKGGAKKTKTKAMMGKSMKPKAQVGKAVSKAGKKLTQAEQKAKSTAKSAYNKAKSTAKDVAKGTAAAMKKADDFVEREMKIITRDPMYKASKYVLKKMLGKKKGGAVKRRATKRK